LQQSLPAPLASHVSSVALKPGELVVYAEAAPWSARLRYALAEMEQTLTARNGSALKVTVRVKPPRTD